MNLRADQDDIDKRIALLVRERVRVASFAQAPGEALVKRLRDAGVVTMPTVGAPRHAEKVAAWGVDALIAQGAEGGGHTGTIPTSLLLPAVVDAVDIPVLAAGGFTDGRGLVAALAWGAAGVAMGTRFLLTKESTVPDTVKGVYVETPVTGTVVTKRIDGYPAARDPHRRGGAPRALGTPHGTPPRPAQRARLPQADGHVAACARA